MSEVTIEKTITDKGFQRFNPFPGLRPFGMEESHLFFGREGQSDEVLRKLSENRFVAVIGTSGSGKSSLIYCGVIPILYGGFITDAGSDWRIIPTKPGSDPMENLADSLLKAAGKKNLNPEEYSLEKSLTNAILTSSSLGLVDAIKMLNVNKKENTLLLVDQFEELFRFKRSKEDKNAFNESYAFVKLLLEAVKQSEVPIYVVMTMRSDFIGECAHFPELTSLINDSNYLIPQMNREDVREAIVGPVAVGGGKISPHMVQQLLNEIGDNSDQLPILQHALMRTWDYWTKVKTGDEPIGIEHYDAIGRMEKALSEHANEAYDELSEREKVICESLFKTITEKGADNRGIRRPTKIKDIASIAQADEDEIIKIADVFRDSSLSFLTPAKSITPKLTSESVIDISHESLMRIWNRLIIWVDEESSAVNMYLRLAEASALFQEGKTGLWRPPDLQLALNWKEKKKPTLDWATRFAPAFERAMVYLDTSQHEYEAEELNKIKLQKRALRRTRMFAIVLGIASIASLTAFVYSLALQQQAEAQRKIAEEQKVIAEEQKVLAEENALEAQKQKAVALEKEQEALLQKEAAEKQKLIAESQKKLAEQSALEAMKQKGIADVKSKEALEQSQIADKSAKEALAQKSKAEKASEEAYQLRLLSIAQSMSVKSQQVTQDTNQKALVAYQSYLFNKEHGGKEHQPDIYDGLYYTLKMLNVADYNSMAGHSDAIRSICYDPSGKYLYTTGSDGKLFKRNMPDTKTQGEVVHKSGAINRSLAISADGKWLAFGTSKAEVYLFDVANMATPILLKGHEKEVVKVHFSSDNNQLLTLSADGKFLKWDVNSKQFSTVSGAEGVVKMFEVSKDGKTIVTTTPEGKISIFALSSSSPDNTWESGVKNIQDLALSNDGKTLAIGDLKGSVKLFDLSSGKLNRSLEGHTARINDIKFSPNDNQLASASFDGSVQLWDTKNFNLQPYVLKDHNSWVTTLSFSPDGNKLIAGCIDKLIRIWPTNSSFMADDICPKVTRNLTQEEWNQFIGSDIPYEKTCPNIE